MADRSVVDLPPDVGLPFEVFLNGVPQREGEDFQVRGHTLVFERPLAEEGKLGFWRWLSLFLGIAGTYRQNDSVDVIYRRGEQRVVASKLPFRPGQEDWPSTAGRWRKPWSAIVFAASSIDVSAVAVIGSAVIHSRTRASLECVRAATA